VAQKAQRDSLNNFSAALFLKNGFTLKSFSEKTLFTFAPLRLCANYLPLAVPI
jgi:hypothetical protein